MARVSLRLDDRKDRVKKDGTYPLVIFLSHGTKSHRIGLKTSIALEHWDEKEMVVTTIANHKYITAKIKSQLAKAELYLLTNRMAIEAMDIAELSKRILAEVLSTENTPVNVKTQFLSKKLNKQSILDFAKYKIDRLKASNKEGYVAAIDGSLRTLRRYMNREAEDILFSEIDLIFLKNFAAYCIGRGNKPNTISAYLRPLKTLFREAIQEEVIPSELNPFPKFKMPRAKNTKKRSLRIESIQEIRNLDLKKGSAHWDARNYFLFMFNNMGINLIDIAQLKKSQISDAVYKADQLVSGRLEYVRSKNGRQYSIKLTDESVSILNNYNIFEKESKELIFPIGFSKGKEGFNTYKKKRQRINGRIRDLGQMVGLEENITSYYARHSWATIAKRKMVPISVISEGLGHSDLKTTQIYLDTFDDDVLDNANDAIVK